MPRKKSLKKVISQFEPETVYDDADEGFFIFKQYGKAIFRSEPWEPGIKTDIIKFDPDRDTALLNDIQIRESAPVLAKELISQLITVYWDCFTNE